MNTTCHYAVSALGVSGGPRSETANVTVPPVNNSNGPQGPREPGGCVVLIDEEPLIPAQQSDSLPVLISNLGQTDVDYVSVRELDSYTQERAQLFTTGNSAPRYRLDGMKLVARSNADFWGAYSGSHNKHQKVRQLSGSHSTGVHLIWHHRQRRLQFGDNYPALLGER